MAQGHPLVEAIEQAERWVQTTLIHAYPIGQGTVDPQSVSRTSCFKEGNFLMRLTPVHFRGPTHH